MVAYNEVEVSLKAGWLLTMRWKSDSRMGIAYSEVEGGLTQGWVVAYNESGNVNQGSGWTGLWSQWVGNLGRSW